MLALGIKTGSFKTEVAIFQNGQILSYSCFKSNNDEAEKIMPLLMELSRKNKIKLSDIKKVYVIKGPGSFTGLRVGVTVANTIAYLNHAKLYELNSFDYWWTLFHELRKGSKFAKSALLLFAGSQGVYLSEKPGKLGKLINLPDLKSHLKKQKITEIFGDISKEQKTFLKGFKFLEIRPDLPEVIKRARFKAVKIVQPLYLKQPSITQKKP
ncbi:tRNA (adenosine(37)-N6)-threonylcarbamoyltransferase complex dimerization subunit type 1 TsaB [Candidatus Peregrinibacteria bacterium]|nr:tRNA (adenosine(37)-N6)-threonylcarbamoyltransferase complex dimerization subunit type 1 TsaB [Candidatus Peregrinibacteria bacterium]